MSLNASPDPAGLVIRTVYGIGRAIFNPSRGIPNIKRFLGELIGTQPIAPLPVAGTPPIAPGPAPGPAPVTGGELFEDLLRRGTVTPKRTIPVPGNPDFEELLRRPDPRIGTGTTGRVVASSGSAVSILARAAGLLGGLLYPTPTAADDTVSEEELRRRVRERNRRRGPPRRPPVRPRTVTDRPLLLPLPPGMSPDTLPPPSSGRPPTLRLPEILRGPVSVALPSPGTRIRPRPRLVLAPTATPAGLPRQLLGSLSSRLPSPGPTLNPLISSPTAPDRGARLDRMPEPLTALRPGPLQSPPPSDPCSCSGSRSRPKRKRKKRDECYRGTYIERANGLTKTRKEKVPCQ